MRTYKRTIGDPDDLREQTCVEFGLEEVDAFCRFVERVGGSTDVAIGLPGTYSRYLDDTVPEGTVLEVNPRVPGMYRVVGRIRFDRAGLTMLAMAGMRLNDWGKRFGNGLVDIAKARWEMTSASPTPVATVLDDAA